jgi:hypothetical protein
MQGIRKRLILALAAIPLAIALPTAAMAREKAREARSSRPSAPSRTSSIRKSRPHT